jgi:hypothetical protein
MAEAKSCKFIAYEDTGVILMGRIVTTAGTAITQAALSSIAYAVYDVTDYDDVAGTGTATLVIAGTLTISAVVFDSLQIPAIWTDLGDSTGYNFRVDAPVTWIPAAPKRYEIGFLATPASGAAFGWKYQATSRKLRTS